MENWINLFEACSLLFFIVLMFITGTTFVQQVNIWRNNDSAYKRLQIRHKKTMEANLQIIETPVKPVVLRYRGKSNPRYFNHGTREEVEHMILTSLLREGQFIDQILSTSEVEWHEPFYDHRGDQIQEVEIRLGVIPKEHISKFK